MAEIDSRRLVPVTGEDPYAWKGNEQDPDSGCILHRDRPRVG